MQKPECILFDCMETIVDVMEKPEVRLYACWAYEGCGYESLWESSDDFVDGYIQARATFRARLEQYRELNSLDLYRLMVHQKTLDMQVVEEAAASILKNYWGHYTKNCFVDDTVKSTLKKLSTEYPCGIVSNFMVDGGIEALLETHGVLQYFNFVVTSVRTGWKKPHPNIYGVAAEHAKTPAEKVLFVGDDYDCDYVGPKQYGFNAVLLDKENRYPQIIDRIESIQYLQRESEHWPLFTQ